MMRRLALFAYLFVACIASLAIGFSTSFGLSWLDAYGYASGNDATTLLWKVINYCGWYWWSIPIGLSVIGLYYMSKLAAPQTWSGTASRIFLYSGFTCYVASWGNNALGPVAAIMVMVGVVLIVRQMAVICAALRKGAPHDNSPLAERVLMSLVEGHRPSVPQDRAGYKQV